MQIDLLVVPDCPNEQPTAALLRQALDEIGLIATTFEVTIIKSEAEAEQHRFVGSPTIRINGNDPFATADRPPAVACRMYANGLGVPDLPDIRRALKRAAGASKER